MARPGSTHQQVSSAEPKIKTEALKDRLQYSSENLLEGDVESRGERLRDSFDVMIVGDLFYDQDIGDAICRLTAAFQVQAFWVPQIMNSIILLFLSWKSKKVGPPWKIGQRVMGRKLTEN